VKEDTKALSNDTKYKSRKGSYKNHRDPYFGYSQTDVYYNTEMKIPDSGVAIPTYDAVVEAKEWVDDINKK